MSGINKSETGFSIVEIIMACAIFPIIVVGIANAYDAVRKSYTLAKQLNEMYAVLSACPELDRALEYGSLSSSTNCYPNNTFASEGARTSVITYTPTVTVTETASLPGSDPLQTVPDSKVINISVGYLKNAAPAPLQLRILITRNGIGQL